MDKKIIRFDDNGIEEYGFHQYKSPILINAIDIHKIIVSNKFGLGKQDFNYFIGYKGNKKIIPLCMFFPETNAYRIDFMSLETEFMSFFNER